MSAYPGQDLVVLILVGISLWVIFRRLRGTRPTAPKVIVGSRLARGLAVARRS